MMDSTLLSTLEQAVAEGKLLADSLTNIQLLLAGTQDPVAPAAIAELAAAGIISKRSAENDFEDEEQSTCILR